MVLLTSGQVSVAISSFIVFLFTSALFLSGYTLQQKTVRDLRAAIKPKAPPPPIARLYLPEQFKEAKPSPKENMVQVVEIKITAAAIDGAQADSESRRRPEGSRGRAHQQPLKVADQSLYDLPMDVQPVFDPEPQPTKQPLSTAERRRRIKQDLVAGSEEEGFKGYRRRMW